MCHVPGASRLSIELDVCERTAGILPRARLLLLGTSNGLPGKPDLQARLEREVVERPPPEV